GAGLHDPEEGGGGRRAAQDAERQGGLSGAPQPRRTSMTDRATSLAGRLFRVMGGELAVGDVPVSRLVEQFGTPLYVYDGAVLKAKWQLMRDTLPGGFTVAYSVKANPNPAIIAVFLSLGAELEIASGGELHCALLAGGTPAEILYA